MQSSFAAPSPQPAAAAASPHTDSQAPSPAPHHNHHRQDQELHPYSDAHIAATLSLLPFSEHCKLRDVWAAKPLVRGRYEGLCGGDPAQRERREDYENIALPPTALTPSSVVVAAQVEPYSRSAAGKIIDPRLQRTPLALEKTMHFLVEHYLRSPHTPLVYTEPFRIWGYLWDRLRGIRTTWGPQLPPSNVSLTGYVDSESGLSLPTQQLHRESERRVRWLEFTAAALAVGGAYLCLTPKGCQRFMQDKKQFLESMSQCFTDLTVYYRAEQRQRNAEFFSVLLLLYGLNQEMKVEDRATFCRFHRLQVNGAARLCPEAPAESVNLSQVNRELERQPYMLDTQPVRAALELIYCWSTRRWFDFFALCKSLKLTPLQRAVVFQSFTYARFRAVLDLVLPNLYVYTKLRVRSAVVAVDELAAQLMMEPTHCLLFLKAMGLGAHLERKVPAAATAVSEQQQQQTPVWHLNISQSSAEPLVTAEELEERCSSKQVLFFPTYPEFFGFRVWREAYTRFPNAAGLARGGEGGGDEQHSSSTTAAVKPNDASPAGRGATQMPSRRSSDDRGSSEYSDARDDEGGAYDAHSRDDESGDRSGDYHDDNDADDYYKYDEEEAGDDDGSNGDGYGDEAYRDEAPRAAPSATHTAPPSPVSALPPAAAPSAAATSDAELLRCPGCPVNLMEVLEVYCPPYNRDVQNLKLADASPALFAQLQSHRSAMLRRCRRVRRHAQHWQEARAGTLALRASDDEDDEKWVEKKEAESASTCSSVVGSATESDDDAQEEQDAAAAAAVLQSSGSGHDAVGAAAQAAIAAADSLVGACGVHALYAAAAADRVAQQETAARKEQEAAAEKAAAASSPLAPPPLPHIPRLSLPQTGACTVEPLPDAHADSSDATRCNAQNSRVTVESPASVKMAKAGGFLTSSSGDVREDSAETVEPQPPTAPVLFPGRPSQPAFVFGAAATKAVVPPMQFNTAMPTHPTGAAPFGAPAAARADEDASSTTPTAASRDAARRASPQRSGSSGGDGDDDGGGSGSHTGSRSSSSAPMLEYSHLKRRSRAHTGHGSSGSAEGSDKGGDEEVDEYDVESGEEGEAAREASRSSSKSSADANREVTIPSHAPARPQLSPPLPAPSSASAAEICTPHLAAATRRRRREERSAAVGSSASSGEDEAGDSEDVQEARRKRCRRDAVGQVQQQQQADTPLLPLAPHEVDVFAARCIPLIQQYLQLWAQLTEGDVPALQDAAACVLRARSRSSNVTASRVPGVARTLAQRAKELLTTAVLRGSMSEYGLHLWDAAAAAAPSIPHAASHASSTASRLSLGELWTTSARSSSSSQRRAVLRGDTRETLAARFSRGCSAARIDGYEVQALMAVESGCVPVLSAAQSSPHTCAPSALSLPRALTAVREPNASAHRRSQLALSMAITTALRNTAAVGQTRRGASQASPLYTRAAADAGVRAEAVVQAVTAAMEAAGGAAAGGSAVSALGTSTILDGGDGGAAQVVFDASIGHYVAWVPPAAAADASSSLSLEAPVLQLTSTFVLISSAWGAPPASSSSAIKEEEDHSKMQQQHHALETIFAMSKERWLAQLLLPSTAQLDAEEMALNDNADASLHYADLRNNSPLWLSKPSRADATDGPVLRLFQRDHLASVPVHAVTALSHCVPVAMRVGLYACDASTLPRLRVRRDGGIRLDPRPRDDINSSSNNNNDHHPSHPAVPASMNTSLAMAHTHYTALVAVDADDAAGVAAAQRTLLSVVESHVPKSAADGAVLATRNTVAGVLLCLVSSPPSSAAIDGADDAAAAALLISDDLETFFWQQWEARHGAADVSASTAPAVVSVCLPYGDAAAAAAAVEAGMQTVVATYAQQAAAVLAEA